MVHSVSLLCVIQNTKAPAMAENEVGSQKAQVLKFLETQLHNNNDGVDNFNEEYVFSVDPTLLIDPSLIEIGKSIGEGGNSIVYEGLWVPVFVLKLTLFIVFLFLFLNICMLLTLCAFFIICVFSFDLVKLFFFIS